MWDNLSFWGAWWRGVLKYEPMTEGFNFATQAKCGFILCHHQTHLFSIFTALLGYLWHIFFVKRRVLLHCPFSAYAPLKHYFSGPRVIATSILILGKIPEVGITRKMIKLSFCGQKYSFAMVFLPMLCNFMPDRKTGIFHHSGHILNVLVPAKYLLRDGITHLYWNLYLGSGSMAKWVLTQKIITAYCRLCRYCVASGWSLNHCGLVMPFSVMNLHQHGLR